MGMNMWFVTILILLLPFCAGYFNDQRVVVSSAEIQGIVGLSTYGDNSCAPSISILRTGVSENCFLRFSTPNPNLPNDNNNNNNNNGNLDYEGEGTLEAAACPLSLRGSDAMACAGTSCFVSDTSARLIKVVNQFGAIQTSFGSNFLVNPSGIAVVKTGNVHDIYVVDTRVNASKVFRISWTDVFNPPENSSLIDLPVSFSGAAGVITVSSSHIFVSLVGSNSILKYTKQGVYVGTVGRQTSVKILTTDYQDRLYVFDDATLLTTYYTPNGEVIDMLPMDVRAMATNRHGLFIADQTRVLFYKEAVELQLSVSDVTCLSRGGSVSMQAFGGVGPYAYRLFPDRNFIPATASNISFNNLITRRSTKVIMYDDKVHDIFTDSTTVTSNPFTPFTPDQKVHPNSGIYFYSFTPSGSGSKFSLTPNYPNYIIPTTFSGIELYVNPGEGNQHLMIAMTLNDGTYFSLFTIRDNNIEPGKWTKLSFSFMYLTPNAYTGVNIVDLGDFGATSNSFYVDDISLLPYEYDFSVNILDACQQNLTVPFALNYVSDYEASFQYSTPSCIGDGDGAITATVTGGSSPYKFSWTVNGTKFENTSLTMINTNHANDTIIGLPKITSNTIIYSSGTVLDGWTIETTATYQLCDPVYNHSCTLSITASGSQYFRLSRQEGIDSYKYSGIQFWINGGSVGGQQISVSVFRDQLLVQIIPITQLIYLPAIPANKWVKAFYNMKPLLGVKYDAFVITSTVATGSQPTIYFDDITLVSEDNTIKVVDSTGCEALVYYEVPDPKPIEFTVSATNVKCHGSTDGIMEIFAVGGHAPYTYGWTGQPQNSSRATGLPAAEISVDITDRKSCLAPKRATATILQPSALQAVLPSVAPPKCFGQLGSITATAEGGVGPYVYKWQRVTDATAVEPVLQAPPRVIFEDTFAAGVIGSVNGNTSIPTCSKLQISPYAGYCALEFPPLLFNHVQFGCPSCIDFRTDTGVQFYVFLTNSSDAELIYMTLLINDLPAVEPITLYNATQAHNSSYEFPINQWVKVFYDFADANLLNVGKFSIYSNNSNQGHFYIDSIVVTKKHTGVVGLVSGNELSPVALGFNSIAQVSSGTYKVTLKDANGCEIQRELLILEPSPLEFTTKDSSKVSEGLVDLNATGGVPPYKFYLVSTNQEITPASIVDDGDQVIRVVDSNECESEKTIKVLLVNKYSSGLVVGLAAVISIGLLIFAFAALMLGVYWVKFISHGSFYSAVLLSGIFVSMLSAIVLLPNPTDGLCVSFIWLLGIGFILVYGCLFIKTWALYKVWSHALQYKRTTMTPMYIMKVLGVALLIEILIIWTVVDPPRAVKVKMVNDTLEKQCDSDTLAFWIVFLSVKGVWLIFGAVLCVLTRDIMKEHNESPSIAYSIYNNVVLLIVAVPLAILLKEVPGGRLVIMVAVIVLAYTFTMCIMFFKIWHRVLAPEVSILARATGKSSTSSRRSNYSRESKHSAESKATNSANTDNNQKSSSNSNSSSSNLQEISMTTLEDKTVTIEVVRI